MTWPFPRLRFRLRTGRWCDHLRDVAGVMNPATSRVRLVPDLGMDDGQMVDMGRAKIYTCQRCGWATFHPDGRDRSEWLAIVLPLLIGFLLFLGLAYLLCRVGA